jgi:hypothetical protein
VNPLKGEAPLKLGDGREFIFQLDFEALVEAEQAYGKPLPRLMADASQGYVGAVRALLLGGLRRHHPDFTADDATAIILTDFEAVANGMMAAVDAAFPKAEGKESGNAVPTGPTSGRDGAKAGSTRTPSGGKRRAPSN